MTWAVMSGPPGTIIYVPGGYGMTDVLFGWPVHHAVVAVALYAGFAAWCLLAVVRNIKRDPAGYEIFTPAQALGFLFFINLIFIGFFRWSRWSAAEAQADLLGLNTTLCFVLGVALLRTRDRVRRLDARRRLSSGWLAAAWPAPYLAAGTLLVGLVPVAILQVSGKFLIAGLFVSLQRRTLADLSLPGRASAAAAGAA